MLWIDHKYIALLSGQLRNFKRKSDRLWNFSCPLCGDSEKNKFKARAYVYEKKGTAHFFCHNCGASYRFKNFLKEINEPLYLEYAKEELLERENHFIEPAPVIEKPVVAPVPSGWLTKLKKVSQLDHRHPAKLYIEERMIPPQQHYRIFYVPKFFAFTNWILPNKFREFEEEPRILIPFLDENGHAFGYQGRRFQTGGENRSKYYTIMLEERPAVWGLDTYKKNHRGYALEGPLDAMFLDNAVASLGGSILRDLNDLKLSIDRVTIVYDNERRSKETVKKMRKSLHAGFRTCVWPDSVTDKDVNDMVRSWVTTGMTLEQACLEVKRVIDHNTYTGEIGLVHLSEWSRA